MYMYLSELLTCRYHKRASWYSSHLVLEIPRSRYKLWGHRAFAVAGPKLWDNYPPVMHAITDLGTLSQNLFIYNGF